MPNIRIVSRLNVQNLSVYVDARGSMRYVLFQTSVYGNMVKKNFTSINLESFTFQWAIDFCMLIVDHTRCIYALGAFSRLREHINTFRSLTRLSHAPSYTYRDAKMTLTTPWRYLPIVTAIENPWERLAGQLVDGRMDLRFRNPLPNGSSAARNQLLSWRNLTCFNRVRRSASLASLETYSYTVHFYVCLASVAPPQR